MQGNEMDSEATAVSPTESEIAAVAYLLWLKRGCPEGSDQDDWFGAEALLKDAFAARAQELAGRPSAPSFDARTQSEMLDELVVEGWQEGHWEVWEREWGGARWVRDLRVSRVGASNRAGRAGKAA
jgi:hypothetical protein